MLGYKYCKYILYLPLKIKYILCNYKIKTVTVRSTLCLFKMGSDRSSNFYTIKGGKDSFMWVLFLSVSLLNYNYFRLKAMLNLNCTEPPGPIIQWYLIYVKYHRILTNFFGVAFLNKTLAKGSEVKNRFIYNLYLVCTRICIYV